MISYLNNFDLYAMLSLWNKCNMDYMRKHKLSETLG